MIGYGGLAPPEWMSLYKAGGGLRGGATWTLWSLHGIFGRPMRRAVSPLSTVTPSLLLETRQSSPPARRGAVSSGPAPSLARRWSDRPVPELGKQVLNGNQ
jgi:hypothetical protein